MTKYRVHLYPTVRVTVTGVEADSPQAAFDKALEAVSFYDLFEDESPSIQPIQPDPADEMRIGSIGYAESDEGALVDQVEGVDQHCQESFEFPGPGRELDAKAYHLIGADLWDRARAAVVPVATLHLIAAAPELLAVLRELVNGPNAKQNDLWDRARAAVAKAEGSAAE